MAARPDGKWIVHIEAELEPGTAFKILDLGAAPRSVHGTGLIHMLLIITAVATVRRTRCVIVSIIALTQYLEASNVIAIAMPSETKASG